MHVSRRALLVSALAASLLPGLAFAQSAPVRVGYIPILGAAPLFVADKEGYAKAAGLEFKMTVFESGPNMISALASGTLDVYVAGVAPLAVARSKGINAVVLTATAVEEMTVAAGASLAPFFASGVKPADAFKAFRAKTGKPARLATQPPGSVPHTTLVHWLFEVTKTDKADVEIVPMGIDATQQALLAAAVDGATIREPTVAIVQGRNPAIRIVALGGEMFPNQPGTVVAVSEAFLKKNPQAAQAIADAIVKATDLINKDHKRVAPHIENALGRGLVDVATIQKALASPASKFVADPRVIVDSTDLMQKYQVSIGTLDKAASLEGLFDHSFYLKAVEKAGGK
jgi:NitT/TauT family transport system substrate-binding protein